MICSMICLYILLSFISILLINCDEVVSKISLRQIITGERIFIETETNRQVLFHGVNAIVKGFPYIPIIDEFDIDLSLSDLDHQTLSSLGVNVYRLGTMWPGVEPIQGQYNETYMDILKQIIYSASQYGIYTLFDLHQDVINEEFCGEGAPDHAILHQNPDDTRKKNNTDFPLPVDDPYENGSDGYPSRSDCDKHSWTNYYSSRAASYAFEQLYNVNSTESPSPLQSWAKFWQHLAQFGTQKGVLGYELMNEPWAGDIFGHPELLIPGVADKYRLQPAYDYIAEVIREVDKQTLIFFAAVTWDDFVPAGFTHAPGGAEYSDGSVFAFHYYELPQVETPVYFHKRTYDARRLEVGAFLTEFERSNGDLDDDPVSSTYNRKDMDGFIKVTEACDSHKVSWAMWEYKTFCRETTESIDSNLQAAAFGSCKTGYGSRLIWNDNGQVNEEPARKLARTYPQKTAGLIVEFHFNYSTSNFEMTFEIDTSISLPTEVFAHQLYHYPNGMDITTFPPGKVLNRMISDNIVGFYPTKLANSGEVIAISIKNKQL